MWLENLHEKEVYLLSGENITHTEKLQELCGLSIGQTDLSKDLRWSTFLPFCVLDCLSLCHYDPTSFSGHMQEGLKGQMNLHFYSWSQEKDDPNSKSVFLKCAITELFHIDQMIFTVTSSSKEEYPFYQVAKMSHFITLTSVLISPTFPELQCFSLHLTDVLCLIQAPSYLLQSFFFF